MTARSKAVAVLLAIPFRFDATDATEAF